MLQFVENHPIFPNGFEAILSGKFQSMISNTLVFYLLNIQWIYDLYVKSKTYVINRRQSMIDKYI